MVDTGPPSLKVCKYTTLDENFVLIFFFWRHDFELEETRSRRVYKIIVSPKLKIKVKLGLHVCCSHTGT